MMATAKLTVPILVDMDSIRDYLAQHDIVEVVRCKDCEKWQEDKLFGLHLCEGRRMDADDYCSKPIRRSEE